MEKLTIRDVAKKAGVSVATVSRAINPRTRSFVKKHTRNKILAMVKKLGYLPSPVAQRLATGKSTNLGIYLGTRYRSIFYNDYYMKILGGVMEVLEESRFHLTIRMMKLKESVFDLNREIQGIDLAACIVCDLPGVLQVSVSGLDNVTIPVAVLNRLGHKEGVFFSACDNFNGAYEATRHLIGFGHQRIAIVKGTYYEKDTIERFDGYKKALEEKGIGLRSDYVYEGDYSEKTGFRALGELIALKERPTAIFCSNDEIAIGALMKIRESGLRCPRDISIIGFDGIAMGGYLMPKLTTVRQPVYEMARMATQHLLRSLEGGLVKGDSQLIRGHLVKGGTCAKPPSRIR